jgi:hypothetical protein
MKIEEMVQMLSSWNGVGRYLAEIKTSLSENTAFSKIVSDHFDEYQYMGVLTGVKISIPDEQALSHGGINARRNLIAALNEYAKRFLRENGGGTIILSKYLARPHDPAEVRNDIKTKFYFGEDVYAYITMKQLKEAENILKDSLNFLWSVYFSKENFEIPTRESISHDLLEKLADSTAVFMCEAFDGEAALVFQKY